MKSLQRGIQVIRSVMALEPCSLHQLHQDTRLPKSTLLRILGALESAGVIFRPIDDKRYRLSAAHFLPGRDRDLRLVLQELSVPVLSALCRDVVWPSDLVVRHDTNMIVVASNRMLSPFAIKPSAHGHQPDMLLTAVGRAYLAFCPEEERETIIAAIRAERPEHRVLGDMDRLAAMLVKARTRGYAVRSRLKTDGFSAVAVPVLVRGRPAACLNLFYYKSAVSVANLLADHLARLQQAAAEIADRLGAEWGEE